MCDFDVMFFFFSGLRSNKCYFGNFLKNGFSLLHRSLAANVYKITQKQKEEMKMLTHQVKSEFEFEFESGKKSDS